MPLPFLFASVASLSTPQLDANFAALGSFPPIPCGLAGTNALTLTPVGNAPSIPAFSNYMQFSAVAGSTNTGAVTAAVAGFGALNVYKDTLNGPVLLSGSEIVAGCAFTLMYDAALGGGAGGFHLFASTNIAGTSLNPGNVNAAALQLNSGTQMVRYLSATATLGTIVIGPATSADSTIALSGVRPNDGIFVGGPGSLNAGVGLFGFVPASGSIILRAVNANSTSVTLAAATYRVSAIA